MTPRVLAERYQLGPVLGQGGMAVVYDATDLRLGRRVAVKVLREQFSADQEFLARFEREARAAAALSHPNIMAVFDVGSDENTHFIVMEYVPGEDLKSLLRREAPLRADRIVSLGTQLCLALDYAHRQGVVHRDVKPHNILVTPSGEVKVADFGIAVALGAPSLTQSGVVLGTAQYIAPEQALGESGSPASDVYGAGVVLFELATGRVPFQAENLVAVARMHVDRKPPVPSSLNPQLPRTLDAVILQALAKDPAARFSSAGEMARALQAHQSQSSERTTRVPVVAPRAQRPAEREAEVLAPSLPRRHVVARPRHRESQSAWPLVLVSGFALVAALAFIPFGYAWLQSGGERALGFLTTPPVATPAPTRTVRPTPRPVVVVESTATPEATPEASVTPTLLPVATRRPSPTATTPPTPSPSPRPTQRPSPSATPAPPTPAPSPTPAPPSPTPTQGRVPLVEGMRVDDARTQLNRMGWQVRTAEVKHAAPKGIVVDQAPSADTLLPLGVTITLSISKGD